MDSIARHDYSRIHAELTEKLGRLPTRSELSEAANVSFSTICRCVTCLNLQVTDQRSLREPDPRREDYGRICEKLGRPPTIAEFGALYDGRYTLQQMRSYMGKYKMPYTKDNRLSREWEMKRAIFDKAIEALAPRLGRLPTVWELTSELGSSPWVVRDWARRFGVILPQKRLDLGRRAESPRIAEEKTEEIEALKLTPRPLSPRERIKGNIEQALGGKSVPRSSLPTDPLLALANVSVITCSCAGCGKRMTVRPSEFYSYRFSEQGDIAMLCSECDEVAKYEQEK